MNKFLTKTREIIFASQTSMLSSTMIISGMMLLARLFGFLRYRVLTGYFSTPELDIFFASFRIPDLVFEILITGALTTTFIPFFIKYKNDEAQQSKHISSIINCILILVAVLIVILILLMPWITVLITPGFSAEKNRQIAIYSQLLLLGQLPFLVLGNFLTGIAQARKTFILPAIAPAIYNIAIIITTILFYPTFHLMAPILGVVAGAVLFFIVQLPIIKYSHFRYQAILYTSKEAWQFFRMAVPRILTSIVGQIDATVDLTLTTLVGAGAYTMFYFAQHLQLLPISLIGIAFGQASLPYLSELYHDNKIAELKRVVLESILNVIYLTVPIMCYLIIARTPIIRLFFGGDKFDWESTVVTAKTLSFFALSLPFHSIYYFLTRCFYAVFDSKTPFYSSVITILINAVLSVWFIVYMHWPVWSLGISFSISMNINVIILLMILTKRLHGFDWRYFLTEIFKIIIAATISGCIVFFSQRLFDGLIFDTTRTINVFFLLVTNAIIFALLYLGMTWVVGINEMYLLTKMALKIKEYQRKVVEMYTGVQ